MNISVVPGDQLSADHCLAWSRLQQADPSVDSPFFRHEFTQAVASIRENVEVAQLCEDDGPAGFFPYQRDKRNIGKPVGGILSDFQGGIFRPGLAFNARDLVRACGLSAWNFDHLIASQAPFRKFHWVAAESPYMDLSGGFEAYQTQRRRAGSLWPKKTLQKARKLAREVAPLRYEPQIADRDVFHTLIDWKVKQYQRENVFNCLALDWTVPLLELLMEQQSQAFSGMLSALYVGERLLSVEFGIRSFHVYNSWFKAYDPELARYSPGMIHTVMFAQASPSLGIRRIDLGKGTESYKQSLASGALPLAAGSVDLRPVTRVLRRSILRKRQWIRTSPLEAPARRLMRTLRSWRNAALGTPAGKAGAPRSTATNTTI
jgi:CelD/BcsL family acetyltransferase involved in cellulose biosynthesis